MIQSATSRILSREQARHIATTFHATAYFFGLTFGPASMEVSFNTPENTVITVGMDEMGIYVEVTNKADSGFDSALESETYDTYADFVSAYKL